MRTLVAEDPVHEGAQVLVTIWDDGTVDVATRGTPWEVWSPPARAREG